jgi:copper chaperone CopZ
MKFITMVSISVAALVFVPLASVDAAEREARAGSRAVTLKIEKMACGSCAKRIANILEDIEGVKSAEVSFDSRGAVVDYDPSKVTAQQLADAVNEAGFKASVAEPSAR